MEWYYYLLIVLFSILLISFIIYPFLLGYILFTINLKRTKKSKWGRNCSAPNNEEQIQMWNKGLEFISNYKDNIKEVSITNDNLKLYGEYVDIGADRCVILLGGRCECLYYAYYYAKPYLTHNCNVLVIDQRAHGKSDGKYSTVGIKESNDIIAWAKFLHDTYSNKEIYIHGTCIGGASGIHALSKENCPSYITKIIVDGLFTTYYETFKQHMIALKKPTYPYIDIVFAFYKLFVHVDAKKYGPISVIDKVKTDILFISSLQDQYITKEDIINLYSKCGSKNKQYVFLPYGKHSHVRLSQEEKYDQLVIDFIK